MRKPVFQDRADAGQALVARLSAYAADPDVTVLALPRGGVPVAAEVARALRAPLDVFVVRKLGVPGNEELAMGAIASGGIRPLNADLVDALRIPPCAIDAVAAREQRESKERERHCRGGRPPADGRGRPAHLVVAVPTVSRETLSRLKREADAVVCIRPAIERAVLILGGGTALAPWLFGFAANDAATWAHGVIAAVAAVAAATRLRFARAS